MAKKQKLPKPGKKRIAMYSPDGTLVGKYAKVDDILAEHPDWNSFNIWLCTSGLSATAYGYKFEMEP